MFQEGFRRDSGRIQEGDSGAIQGGFRGEYVEVSVVPVTEVNGDYVGGGFRWNASRADG